MTKFRIFVILFLSIICYHNFPHILWELIFHDDSIIAHTIHNTLHV